MSKKTMTNEFLVRYMDDFEKYHDIINTSCKNWNKVATNQLRRRINHTEKVFEDERKHTKTFQVNFQNGSKAYFLFIPKEIDIFVLHEEIRSEFKEGIEEHDKLSFNLLNLKLEHQEILISILSSAIHLYQWEYPKYGKKSEKTTPDKKNFGFYCDIGGDKVHTLIKNGEAIAEGTNLVRTLACTPTNYLTSKDFVKKARDISKKLKGVQFDFLNEEKLKEIGCNCFLAVLRGSKGSRGGIVNLSYKTRFKNAPRIAIIGKGVVFDTGGYNLKTDSLLDMHRDMTGAAVGLALFQSLVKTKAKANIDLYLAIGESLISEKAYKPNEVVLALDGTSVEIKDTDAEGRLMLIDTIIYAKAAEPDIIIDFATLTGSAIGAMGTKYSCIFSNDYELSLEGVIVGKESGERVWNFPTSEDFLDSLLESDVADITHMADEENADHIYAATFLQYFIGNIPWVHIDLSSESNDGGLGLVDSDVTGFGVRWGFEFLQKYINKFKGENDG